MSGADRRVEGTPRAAAALAKLCRAMLHALTAQPQAYGRLQLGCYGIQAVDDDCVREVYSPAPGYNKNMLQRGVS